MKSNNAPLVTVAMVTYNSAQFVGLAIESVLASSYRNFELIICDDGSQDDTHTVIQSFNDERLRVYFNEVNLGEYANRNKCLDLARGKYIIYIDGDDLIYPNGLEHIVRMAEAFPGVGMALALRWRDYVFYPYVLKPRENMLFTYFGESFLYTSFAQTLFNTQALRDVGGMPVGYISGDSYVKKLISLSHDVLLVSGPIAWWRRTPGQASSKLAGGAGLIENFNIDREILRQSECPLDGKEKKMILRKHKENIFREGFKQLLKLHLIASFHHFKICDFNCSLLFKKKYKKLYKNGASSIKPLMLPFSKNPFSSNTLEN